MEIEIMINNKEATQEQRVAIIRKACKAGAIPKSKVMDVVNQWESSDHLEFRDRNLNSLYNGFTEIYKGNLGRFATRKSSRL